MISTLWKNDRKKYVSVPGCQDNLMWDTKLAVRNGGGGVAGYGGGGLLEPLNSSLR